MEYLFIARQDDTDVEIPKAKELMTLTKAELVDRYNEAYKLGLVGYRAQVLQLIALHVAFNKIFKQSPFRFSNSIFAFTQAIVLVGENWKFAKTE